MKRVVLCARGASGPAADRQLRQLRRAVTGSGWQIVGEHADRDGEERGAPDRLLTAVEAGGAVELVAVTSPDRLGRSPPERAEVVGRLGARGVGLYLQRQALETAPPAGMVEAGQWLEALAEGARARQGERIKAGVARAKAAGKRLGRPPVLEEAGERIGALRADGLSVRRIAAELGVPRSTVADCVARRDACRRQTLEAAIAILRAHQDELRRLGVVHAAVDDPAAGGGQLRILVELEEAGKLDLFALDRLQPLLRRVFSTPVDVFDREGRPGAADAF